MKDIDVSVAGVTVRVTSNSRDVIEAARRRFAAGGFHNAASACRLEVSVAAGSATAPAAIEVHWEFPGDDRAVVAAAGLSAEVGLESGIATVQVEDWFVRNAAQFRRTVLEGIVFMLLTRRDRHPVHASVLRVGDAALLLHGPSGVGKSTLAYAAWRAGVGVLADDVARVQLQPELRVWGDGVAARIHLVEGARNQFAELPDHRPERISADGLEKLVVDASQPGTPPPFVRAARICLLARHRGPVVVRDATPGEIRDTMLGARETAFDRAPAQRARVVDALASPGGWHLTLSADPSAALPHVQRMLAQIPTRRVD